MSESAKDFWAVMGIASAICIFSLLIAYAFLQASEIEGDMNRDGVRDIIDLSILAAKIQEQ